jgi:lipopolysaccharide/colanic/teichoic acid biosynthesis glycosyltransferase
MTYFSIKEIFASLVASVFLGTAFGLIYSAVSEISDSVKRLVFIFPNIKKLSSNFSFKEARRLSKERKSKSKRVGAHISEFVLFLIFGIAFIIAIYIYLDGVFRVYMLLGVSFVGVCSKKIVWDKFSYLYKKIFDIIYAVLLTILTLLYMPFFLIFGIIVKILRKILRPVKICFMRNKSARNMSKKIKYCEKMYEYDKRISLTKYF